MTTKWLVFALALGCAGKQAVPATTEAPPQIGQPAAAPRFVAVTDLKKSGAEKSPGLAALELELQRAMKELKEQDPPPYFIAYEVHDRSTTSIDARNGALVGSNSNRFRVMDVDVRVGSHKFDSGHPLTARAFDPSFGSTAVPLPIDDDAAALRSVAWKTTEQRYKSAAERFVQLKTRRNVDVGLEDKSDDFSKEKPVVLTEPPATITVDVPAWENRVRALSARFRQAPDILQSGVSFNAGTHNRWLVNSEGSLVQAGRPAVRVSIFGTTRAEDGQDLHRYESFDATSVAGLPTEAKMAEAADRIITDLRALRAAPPAEPFSGPAILQGKAAAVFFHEIFGHRVEGHRQKDETEGQTFAKKIGQPIMPSFISVFDDPRLSRLGDLDLNGFYLVDDEGVVATRASLVDAGIMKGFLLGRTPTRGFNQSNGHGRRQEGRRIVPRQANLVVQPSLSVPRAELRDRLRAEAKRQGKAYGLYFNQIDGGFTTTARMGPQAFKVLPVMVYRIFVDGRPDQLIRGADLVGTPLSALSKILAASDDYEVFNGYCGAESGSVPVSGVSPSLLVEQLEIERKYKGQDKPPVLPAPGGAP
ncbi:MAG TPA: metallopeptidase TldD-related protein [Polyangia bacterium]|nr:metallopeptidase TldD-related protein [Polyangia bacterium]